MKRASASSRTILFDPRIRMEQVLPGLATPVISARPLPRWSTPQQVRQPSLSFMNESMCAIGLQPSDLQMYSMSSRSMSRMTACQASEGSGATDHSRRHAECFLDEKDGTSSLLIFCTVSGCICALQGGSCPLTYCTTTLFSMSVLGALRQN